MAWNKAQAKSFVKQAKDRAGAGWALLGPELQTALLAYEFTSAVTSQMSETLNSKDLEELWQNMTNIVLPT